jgi:GAF domain-containing protein
MPNDRKTLTRELEQLLEGADQLAGEGLPAVLQQVVDAVAPLLQAQGAAVMLVDEREVLRHAAATSGPARGLATAQERLGAGPAHESFNQELPVGSRDVTTDSRWPDLRHLVDPSKVRAVLAAPLCLPDGGPIGTLSVHASRVRDWEVAEMSAILALAGVTATLVSIALEARLRGILLERLVAALRAATARDEPYDG